MQPELDENGLLRQVQLDLGQVIHASPRLVYPTGEWETTYNNLMPEVSQSEVLIEYSAHPEASFHMQDGATIAVERINSTGSLVTVPAARQDVRLRVIEKGSRRTVAVKLHVHGEWGEYLAPVDRHRIINGSWFEDYSVDYAHGVWSTSGQRHSCTYINGDTLLKLPRGKVYIEVSKGFEVKPLRKVVEIEPETHRNCRSRSRRFSPGASAAG